MWLDRPGRSLTLYAQPTKPTNPKIQNPKTGRSRPPRGGAQGLAPAHSRRRLQQPQGPYVFWFFLWQLTVCVLVRSIDRRRAGVSCVYVQKHKLQSSRPSPSASRPLTQPQTRNPQKYRWASPRSPSATPSGSTTRSPSASCRASAAKSAPPAVRMGWIHMYV